MKRNYKATYAACFIGIANQAVVANLTALLFVPFMLLYGFEEWQLGVLIAVNYSSQLVADLILTKCIDRIPYRAQVLIAQALAAVGVLAFALVPFVTDRIFEGFIVSTVVFAFSGGMQEVILTPIIDATEEGSAKSKALGLLHSFYAWGQAFFVVVTALLLHECGYENWQWIAMGWVILPLLAGVLFIFCPINQISVSKEERKRGILNAYSFLLIGAIFFGGATELIVNQYISTFSTLALGFDKTVSDIFGMALFAVMMGVGRMIFGPMGDRIDVSKLLFVCALASFGLYLVIGLSPSPLVAFIACVLSGFTVSFLWPGTLVVAGKRLPSAGAAIFAVLAISGDVGGSLLPLPIGFMADGIGLRGAFAIAAVIPLICAILHGLCLLKNKKRMVLPDL